ncbi:MAG: hypothetical protein ACRDID_24620, partial [Ktedonobacterales bacterium]
MIDRLRAVIAVAEQLPENEQEQLAALWEETLRDNVRWRALFQHPGSADFFEQLRAEAAEAEISNRSAPILRRRCGQFVSPSTIARSESGRA